MILHNREEEAMEEIYIIISRTHLTNAKHVGYERTSGWMLAST
jgi:hypothetical protein